MKDDDGEEPRPPALAEQLLYSLLTTLGTAQKPDYNRVTEIFRTLDDGTLDRVQDRLRVLRALAKTVLNRRRVKHAEDCPGGSGVISPGKVVVFPSPEDLPKYKVVKPNGETGANLPTRMELISTCSGCGVQEGGEIIEGHFESHPEWVPVGVVFEHMLNPPPQE